MANQKVSVTVKSPGLAAVLSFLWCGAGQIYNGQIGKGILMALLVPSMVIVAVLIGVVSRNAGSLLGLIMLAYLAMIILWIYGIVDAYRTAQGGGT